MGWTTRKANREARRLRAVQEDQRLEPRTHEKSRQIHINSSSQLVSIEKKIGETKFLLDRILAAITEAESQQHLLLVQHRNSLSTFLEWNSSSIITCGCLATEQQSNLVKIAQLDTNIKSIGNKIQKLHSLRDKYIDFVLKLSSQYQTDVRKRDKVHSEIGMIVGDNDTHFSIPVERFSDDSQLVTQSDREIGHVLIGAFEARVSTYYSMMCMYGVEKLLEKVVSFEKELEEIQ